MSTHLRRAQHSPTLTDEVRDRSLYMLYAGKRAGVWPMTLIELPDEQAAALKAKAAAQGLSLEGWFKKLAEEETGTQTKPLKSAYGLLAEYGPAPSAEEIDESRRDMFRGFGENF